MLNNYILKTGADGAERLESVQALYGEESKNLLNIAGLGEGKKVIDMGCGTGQMTQWIAQKVGPQAVVIALDNSSEQLQIAQHNLVGLNNIQYLCKNIDELSKSDLRDVDIVYGRLILLHNKDPKATLNNLLNKFPAKTVFVFEEPITSDCCCYPSNKAFNKHLELYQQLAKVNGYDFDFGKKLVDLLLDNGVKLDGIREVRCSFKSDIAKRIAYRRTKECASKYIDLGLVEEVELNSLLISLQELADDNYLISGATMVQAWGTIS